MKVSIFGLGYVGCVSAACVSKAGHEVVGVDVAPAKVGLLAAGKSPVIEKGLETLLTVGVRSGRLRATASAEDAISATDLSLICVGTPSNPNNSLNLDYVARVCEEIGSALVSKNGTHVVCVRSTMVPGSASAVVRPSLERGFGGQLPDRVSLAVNPEFLREGTAVHDFFNPPKTVVGSSNTAAADVVAALYEGIEAPLVRTSIETAEMVKYVDNVFHALKIAFANEIGTVCKSVGVDSHEVMDIFTRDRKLNVSPAYLRPGFAFGGSCLPKDLRALLYRAREKDLDLPLLAGVLPSNDMQIDRAIRTILSMGKKKLGFLGLSFKEGTDDLRESPLVRLIEACIGKGYDIQIFDRNVSLARLVGANKSYIENEIPHVSNLLETNLGAVVDWADVLIVGHASSDFTGAAESANPGKVVFDLARAVERVPDGVEYIGFNW